MSESSNIPEIQDKRPRITGVLPKNAQSIILAGIALFMLLIIVFSNRTPPPKRSQTPMSTAPIPGPNQTRIQDFRSQIEEETRKLAAEEAELAQTKKTLGVSGMNSVRPTSSCPYSTRTATASQPVSVVRPRRESESLFASNIALTYREPYAENTFAPSDKQGMPAAIPIAGAPSYSSNYRLFEGTILETVLTNRMDSTFSGPVSCMLTTNIYSHDGEKLLIPRGSRVLGEVRKVESFGDQRVAVVFHRLIMPDGFSVTLDQFKGLDQVGETGLRDEVNHHYLQVFGASIAIGAFAGLSQAGTRYGLNESAADAYRQGVTDSLSQSAMHMLDRYLNILPTFTVREGYRIKVYLSQDLLLPAYDVHPAEEGL